MRRPRTLRRSGFCAASARANIPTQNEPGGKVAAARPPEWVTIRILLATLDLRSVIRAAEQCGIAVSAAAKRVQMLEAECGVALLERGARGVRPAPAGEVFARHAHALPGLASRLQSDLQTFAGGGLGTVHLHATPSLLAGPELAEALASPSHPVPTATRQPRTSSTSWNPKDFTLELTSPFRSRPARCCRPVCPASVCTAALRRPVCCARTASPPPKPPEPPFYLAPTIGTEPA